MLGQAVGSVLPAAVGVALSPIPIIAIILVLATPKARTDGLTFSLGWVLGLVVVSAVVLVLTSGASQAGSTASDGVNWGQLALGLLFLVMALRQWRGRPAKGEEAEMPTWMAAIDKFGAGRSLLTGVLLSAVNPKNLALTAAAAASVAQLGVSTGDEVAAMAVFVVIASTTVVGPALFYLAGPQRAAAPLGRLKEFMAAHNAVIMTVVLLVLGAKLLGDGLSGVSR